MCILLLVHANPNEQSHCLSQCELIMENDSYEGLQYDSWTANNLSLDFTAVYLRTQGPEVVKITSRLHTHS